MVVSFRFRGFWWRESDNTQITRPFSSFLPAPQPHVCLSRSLTDYVAILGTSSCGDATKCCSKVSIFDGCKDRLRSKLNGNIILPTRPQFYWLAHGLWGLTKEESAECDCDTMRARVLPGLSHLTHDERKMRVVWATNYHNAKTTGKSFRSCARQQLSCQQNIAARLSITVLDLWSANVSLEGYHINWWAADRNMDWLLKMIRSTMTSTSRQNVARFRSRHLKRPDQTFSPLT